MVAVAVAAMAARAAVVMTIVVAKAVPRAAPGAIPQALGEPFVKEQPAAREARRAHLRRGAACTGRSRQSTALVGASRNLANDALGRASPTSRCRGGARIVRSTSTRLNRCVCLMCVKYGTSLSLFYLSIQTDFSIRRSLSQWSLRGHYTLAIHGVPAYNRSQPY